MLDFPLILCYTIYVIKTRNNPNIRKAVNLMPSILILDTETIGKDKYFCYNIGWTIVDLDTRSIYVKKDFVVEQIWHNLPLFSTAYYAEKRQLYVASMRSRKTIMDKWGYIMRELASDIRKNEVQAVFAYNSPFDDKVIAFNCDWFKTNNPLDNIPVMDIRGMVSEFITNTNDYKEFCEEHELFTDAGHYSATAEAVYRYITADPEFVEAHTALADAEIESDILLTCVDLGADPLMEYKVKFMIPRYESKPLKIKVDGETIYDGSYCKRTTGKETVYYYTKV